MELLRVETDGLRDFLFRHESDIAEDGREGKHWGRLTLAFKRLFCRWPQVETKQEAKNEAGR